MNRYALSALVIAALSLSACGGGSSTSTSTDPAQDSPKTLIGKAVAQATDDARRELAKSNISLNENGQPKAEITPAGDLLIEGKTVAVNAEQRALLLAYRKQLISIAESGIGMAAEGADLAGKAVGAAVQGIISGDTDQIEKKIEQEAKGMESKATQLCALLPGLKTAQDKLAATLPEFKPYAKMDDEDVSECRMTAFNRDSGKDNVGQAIAEAIENSREDAEGMNAAEEAEAASVSSQ